MFQDFKEELKNIRVKRLKEDITFLRTQINSELFVTEETLNKMKHKKEILEKELKELEND